MTQLNNLDIASDEPLYNIGIVSRMTGIPVATLRVWERRYNFPNSTRTPGGHRLCSEKEVIRLRWVKARVDEGMQTGQAIRALQHIEQEGRFNEVLPLVPARPPAPLPDPSLATFHERLTELLLDHDLIAADQLLGEVLALYPLEDLILEIVAPTLHDIGTAWLEGQITVATEHLATNFLRHHLLLWMMTGPQPYPSVQPTLLACAPREWHEGSLLITGVLLRRRRWPVAYLGQNVPLEDLSALVKRMRAPAIVFVAMSAEAAEALMEWPQHLPDGVSGKLIVSYGGRIFSEQPAWRERVAGLYLGDTLREGVQTLDHKLFNLLQPKP